MEMSKVKEVAEACQALIKQKRSEGADMLLRLEGAADGVAFLQVELEKVAAAAAPVAPAPASAPSDAAVDAAPQA